MPRLLYRAARAVRLKRPSDAWLDGMLFATALITTCALIREGHYFWAISSGACAVFWLRREIWGEPRRGRR